MALSADDQAFLNFALAALPKWMNESDEFLHGAAKLFGSSVKVQIDYWISQTLIGQATGATSSTPDWLAQHARNYGTARQNGETDPTLRARLRNVPDALTRPALISAANAILTAAGIATSAYMVELPRDAAHFGSFSAMTGTGGTFATLGASPGFQFTPSVAFSGAPYRDPSVTRLVQSYSITIAGAANAGNNGTFPITGLNGTAAKYNNAAGVAGADAGATWTINKFDRRGNALNGHAKAHYSRGLRFGRGSRPVGFVLILPYGTTAAVQASITEMLRQKKAAGIIAIVETRANP